MSSSARALTARSLPFDCARRLSLATAVCTAPLWVSRTCLSRALFALLSVLPLNTFIHVGHFARDTISAREVPALEPGQAKRIAALFSLRPRRCSLLACEVMSAPGVALFMRSCFKVSLSLCQPSSAWQSIQYCEVCIRLAPSFLRSLSLSLSLSPFLPLLLRSHRLCVGLKVCIALFLSPFLCRSIGPRLSPCRSVAACLLWPSPACSLLLRSSLSLPLPPKLCSQLWRLAKQRHRRGLPTIFLGVFSLAALSLVSGLVRGPGLRSVIRPRLRFHRNDNEQSRYHCGETGIGSI